MRSSSCSIVAWALGGPPQIRRSSAWILPCGRPVRWWWAATRALSWRRRRCAAPPRSAAPASAPVPDRRLGAPPPLLGGQLLGLPLVEQHRDLVGGEQPGQAEVLLLLGRTGLRRRCRRRRRRRSPGRARRWPRAPRSASPARRWPARCAAPVPAGRRRSPRVVLRRAQHVVALGLHLAGQPEQVRHARQEDRGGLARAPGADETADRLGEVERRGGAGGVDADGQPGDVDALGDHPDRDQPALVGGGERRRSGRRRPTSSERTTTAFSPVISLQQPRVRPGGLLVAGDDQAAGVGHALPGAARCSRASAARSTCGIQSPAGSSAVRHACATRSWVIGSPRRAASSSPALVRQRVSPE